MRAAPINMYTIQPYFSRSETPVRWLLMAGWLNYVRSSKRCARSTLINELCRYIYIYTYITYIYTPVTLCQGWQSGSNIHLYKRSEGHHARMLRLENMTDVMNFGMACMHACVHERDSHYVYTCVRICNDACAWFCSHIYHNMYTGTAPWVDTHVCYVCTYIHASIQHDIDYCLILVEPTACILHSDACAFS